ncbi:TonB-dependent receptor domain-containing protein [Rufibacter radiotolerans]|uniref:TonB-dependent receptor domain-containing protein n=1 Tax=Rufibacter radiotolerans TaxID=1379910 RepID=UPI000AA763AF|nr:outer membrane beta-barrel family protein [Rufibacter radiotolerans]
MLLTGFFCIFYFITSAQHLPSIITLKGTIADSSNKIPLSYVTIVIKENSNNQVTNSTISEQDGTYRLSILTDKYYQMSFSFIGYKTKNIHLSTLTSPVHDLGTILLSPTATQLEEVQVTAQKPLIEQSIDKTTYHVEADPEVNLLSTLDMLRKVPFLTVDAEDNLTLNGQMNYQILVNGKRLALFSSNPSEVLKTLPANSIKQVEILTNPSACYEAAGTGGVINIITHKRSISGYNGSINLVAGHPESYNGSASLTATAGKVSVTGRYSNNYAKQPENNSIFYRLDNVRGSRLEQTGNGSGENRAQNFGGELTYDISLLDQFTLSYGMNSNNGSNNNIQQVSHLNIAGETTESYQNINKGNNDGNNSYLNLGYQRSFKNNSMRSFSFDLSRNNSENESASGFSLEPIINYTGRQTTTQNQDVAREYNLQADYTHPLGKQTLELGIKSVLQENNSGYFYKNLEQETGMLVLDSALSNSFDYRQDIHAAYASFNLRNNKWVLRTGLRVEETRLHANFRSSSTKASQQYRNLFPNITLSLMLKESSTLKLSYTQRIQRPSLYDLNPYVDATDPLNVSYGNPALDPATSHILQLDYIKYIKATSLSAGLSHHFTNNAIQYFTTLGEDSVARSTYGNLGHDRMYNFSLNSNTTFSKKLTLNLNIGTSYVSYTSMLEGRPQANKGFIYSVRGAMAYRMGKTWRASGNLNYNSPNVLLQGSTSGYTWSSVALNKQFLKNGKASLSLSVRSPFEARRHTSSETTGLTFYQRRESYTVIRQFTVGFNYRFTKLKTSAPPENLIRRKKP